MAAVEVAVTSAPTAITGLADDTRYQAQNVGNGPLRFLPATSAVTDTSKGFYVPIYGEFWFHKVSGEDIYIWAVQDNTEAWYDEIRTE